MSAHMVGNEILEKVAAYTVEMLDAADRGGSMTGIRGVALSPKFIAAMDEVPGVWENRRGGYSVGGLHKALFEMNRKAVVAAYGSCDAKYEGCSGKVKIDTREETRAEWQCRLYSAIDYLLYQCEEGNVPEMGLYRAMMWLRCALADRIAEETAARDWGIGWGSWKPARKGERKSLMRC